MRSSGATAGDCENHPKTSSGRRLWSSFLGIGCSTAIVIVDILWSLFFLFSWFSNEVSLLDFELFMQVCFVLLTHRECLFFWVFNGFAVSVHGIEGLLCHKIRPDETIPTHGLQAFQV